MMSSTIFRTQEKHERRAVRLASAIVVLLAVVCFSAPSALGQCTLSSPTTWSIAGNSNWNTNGDWSPAVYPNSSSTNVCITNGTSTVTLDISRIVGGLQLGSGNILDLNGFNATIGSLNGSGTVTSGVAGAVTLTTGRTGNSGAFNGVIQDGSGTVALTKVGSGTLTLSGANTYTGLTTVNSGTLTTTGALQGGLSNNSIVNAQGTANGAIINNGVFNVTSTLSSNGNFNNASGAQLNINPAAASTYTISGAVSNTGAIFVGGNGTLTSGAGVNMSGGTLAGTGTITGNVNVTGGTIQPGGPTTPGTLTINGDFSHSTAAFNELIGSTGNGLLLVNGTSILGPGSLLNIDLLGGFTPFSGETFTLMDYSIGVDAFADAPSTGFQMDGFNWTIACNSKDIVLDAGSRVTTIATLAGTGTITGNVNVTGGTIQPGGPTAPGTLTINGDLSHSTAAFNELIGSTGNGLLLVSGTSNLGPGSLLNIDLLGGFTPFSGETFTLMDYSIGVGAFADAPSTGFQMDGFNWTIAYNSKDIDRRVLRGYANESGYQADEQHSSKARQGTSRAGPHVPESQPNHSGRACRH
jgi:autotransporter-associated beta strand protein